MGRLRMGRGTEQALARQALVPVAALLLLLVVLAMLAACAGGTGGSAQATQQGGAGATAPTGQAAGTEVPTVTPTTGAVTTPGAQQGTSEFCAASANVAAQLPASVPTYPGAHLRLGQNSGGSGIYGLCTGDSVAAVSQFYASQLPTKGWQQVSTNTNAGVQQVQATKGSAHVFITAEPDAQVSGTTEIIILTSGA